MGRPRIIDDETLLESVRATFLELGPNVASHELARRAGVSEGTLFKRFGTKAALFRAAMRIPDVTAEEWYVRMPDRAGTGDLEENLRVIATGFGHHLETVLPLMQTLHRHGGLSPEALRELLGEEEPPPLQTHARFRQFFEREIELGRLRPASASTLASMFIGAVVHHCHVRLYFTDYVAEDVHQFARRLARDFTHFASPAPTSP